jgi:prefoldin subunit 5
VKSIPIYKQQLASHVTILHDFVSTLRESYSMIREETRTYQSLVHQLSADKSDESDRRLEWLQKLVAVTTIQSKEAERMMMMGK